MAYLHACMLELCNRHGSVLLEAVPFLWGKENHPKMFGLRVDLSALQKFMGQSSSCIPQFEKVTDDIQGNVLFTISFGTLDNRGFYSFGKTLSRCRIIFPSLITVDKELQVWITGWPVNQNQPNVAVHIHLLALHTVARCQETQERKSLAQIIFSKLL